MWVVSAVDVAVEALRINQSPGHGVAGGEPARHRVVVPCPKVVEAGGVFLLARISEGFAPRLTIPWPKRLIVGLVDDPSGAVRLEPRRAQMIHMLILHVPR